MARHNQTTPTLWGHLWITWQSAGSLMAYGWTSMIYAASTSNGNPPEFPALQELVTCSQVRDLLKLTLSIDYPYMILVHSADSVTAVSMLQELHTATCLRCQQVDLWDKSVKLSFCPFCIYAGGGMIFLI